MDRIRWRCQVSYGFRLLPLFSEVTVAYSTRIETGELSECTFHCVRSETSKSSRLKPFNKMGLYFPSVDGPFWTQDFGMPFNPFKNSRCRNYNTQKEHIILTFGLCSQVHIFWFRREGFSCLVVV